MINIRPILGTVLVVVSAVTAQANSVVLTQDAYSFYVAGEFNAVTSQNFLGNYGSGGIAGKGFETFCIETTVDFSAGQTYTYTLAQVDSRGVDLTKGAAWLYSEFGKGILNDYNYTVASTRTTDASELQAAIWWFQGNQTYGGYPSPTNNVFYEEAISALGTTKAFSANDGDYGVDVLQMWNSNGSPAQNQLVLAPDGGATITMFGAALAGLGLVRRLKVA